MIRVTYDRTRPCLRVEGCRPALPRDEMPTPGDVPSLFDIAAMTLSYTLAASLLDLCAAGAVSEPLSSLRPEHTYLACRPSFAARGAALLTFDTVARGFALLAARFPDEMSYEETEDAEEMRVGGL